MPMLAKPVLIAIFMDTLRNIWDAAFMTAHNTFEQPEAVRPVAFDDVIFHHETLTIHLPAKSVVALTCT
jgi:alpha-L-arabinofuranosidase